MCKETEKRRTVLGTKDLNTVGGKEKAENKEALAERPFVIKAIVLLKKRGEEEMNFGQSSYSRWVWGMGE